MSWKIISAALGAAFAAAAIGISATRPSQPKEKISPEMLGPRSDEGRSLENWFEYCHYIFDRDKTYERSQEEKVNPLREVKEANFGRLTQADRHRISEMVSKLHDICRQRNVHLEVSGLTKPVKSIFRTATEIFERPSIVVEVDPARPYDAGSQPNPTRTDRPDSGPSQASLG